MLDNILPFVIFILKILYCSTKCIILYFYIIWFGIYTLYGIVFVIYKTCVKLNIIIFGAFFVKNNREQCKAYRFALLFFPFGVLFRTDAAHLLLLIVHNDADIS